MQYITDPKSGNELSILGFGCMRFPRDKTKTEQLILTAVDAGVNYFDTAYIYPGSETTLGEIIYKNGLREKIRLATKLPYRKCAVTDDFEKFFQKQTERLKTDFIDYYLIHGITELDEWRRLCEMGIEGWISGKKKSGQVRQIGFSFHGAQNEFLSILDAYDWDFCQIQYNYMDENYQAGKAGLQKANQKGIPVIIMEPLLGGKLASGLPRKAERLFREADQNSTPASFAFRWLWNQPEVTVVLSGMNSASQLEENLKTASDAKPGMLSYAQSAVFGPVLDAFKESYKVPCTGCNYCMPCTNGVNIPGCFSAYNTSYAMGFIQGFIQYLTSTGSNRRKKHNRAGNCVGCGVCEKSCPQKIRISKSLTDVKKRMEPFWFGAVIKILQKFT